MSRRGVNAPPGGHSQFSLSDGSGGDARFPLRQSNAVGQSFGANASVAHGSSNAYANGANQNCGESFEDE